MSSVKFISLLIIIFIITGFFSGCLRQNDFRLNIIPIVHIFHPAQGDIVVGRVNITGNATDADNNQIEYVEIRFGNDTKWFMAEGGTNWSYSWNTYQYSNGLMQIFARSYDGEQFSRVQKREVVIDNPEDEELNTHKWAIFVTAANFPEDNASKLGNGGFYLSQNMSRYFVEELGYSTSRVHLLFDDGWLRDNNGFGDPVIKIQNLPRTYNVSYGAATKQNVIDTIEDVIVEANQYDNSEVFIWIFNHGYGDYNREVTGGKLFERSAIFLWDGYLVDNELGEILQPLQSKKTCIMIDACYAGGFASKTILNLPTFPGLGSGIPQNGRVVISSTSKFRTGIAIIQYGPLFSLLWFNGLITGSADGFEPGFLQSGRLPFLMVSDGKVSVEEAFYYARYMLRTNENINEFRTMQPQMNDQYPNNGFIRSRNGLFLGEQ